MRVVGLDHIVIVAADVEKTVAWYHEELGMEVMGLAAYRAGEFPFPSVRVNATTIIDILPGTPTGENLNHFALVVEGTTADELAASGRFAIEDGPGDRSGAQGTGRSIYTRDPAGTLVELRSYPGDRSGEASGAT
jgi:catechol 2,3-dioxygenase-like lactoylglutathione lyase family enzyme